MPFTGNRIFDSTLHSVRINITTLGDLETHGWNITADFDALQKGRSYRKVGLSGFYNAGKSHVLAEMLSQPIMQGFGKQGRTEGISIVVDKNTIYYDVAGYQRASPKDSVAPFHLVDVFVSDWVKQEVDILCIVVSELHKGEQLLIDRIVHEAQSTNQRIVIIHNFKDFTDVEDVEDYIRSDIVAAYGAEAFAEEFRNPDLTLYERFTLNTRGWRNFSPYKYYYWQHTYRSTEGGHPKKVEHYVLAKKGSNAGDIFNAGTIYRLRQLVATDQQLAFSYQGMEDFLRQTAVSMGRILPHFFYDRRISTVADLLIGPKRIQRYVGKAAFLFSPAWWRNKISDFITGDNVGTGNGDKPQSCLVKLRVDKWQPKTQALTYCAPGDDETDGTCIATMPALPRLPTEHIRSEFPSIDTLNAIP